MSRHDVFIGMRINYQLRFQLNQEEVILAQRFFRLPATPESVGPLAMVRTGHTFSPLKTVEDFLDYEYPNGHTGVYPLDTNSFGILTKRSGTYGIDNEEFEFLDDFGEEIESDNEALDQMMTAGSDKYFKMM